MLCLLLAGNNAYSKRNSIFVEPKVVVAATPPAFSAQSRPSPTSVTFTVTGVAGHSYAYQRSTDGASFGSPVGISGTIPGPLLVTDNSVLNGVSYRYKVTATETATSLTASTETIWFCSIATPAITAATPRITGSPLGITLNVGSMASGTKYDVYKRTLGGSFGGPYATDKTDLSIYIDNFLPVAGTTYEYQIIAKNSSGCSSTPSSIRQVPILALPAPVILSATPMSPFQINVQWQGAAGVERWRVLRSENGGAMVEIADRAPSDLVHEDGRNDPRLKPDTEYCYKIIAQYTNGSPVSVDQKCARTPKLPTISNLTATAVNCSRIILNWVEPTAAVVNEEIYHIYRSVNDGAYVLHKALGNNISSYQDDDLMPNTTYAYRVESVYVNGLRTPLSDAASAKTQESKLTLLNNTVTTANIQWNKCSPFTQGWKIYVSTNDGPFVEKAQVGPNEDKYSFTGLLPLTKYVIYVVNIFGSGTGGATNSVSFTTPKFPGATNALAVPTGTNSMKLTWKDNSNSPDNEEGFIVYKSIDNGVTYTQIARPPVFTDYTDTGLKPSQKVCYYVVAFSSAGFAEASNTTCDFTCPNLLPEFTKVTPVSTTEINLEWAPIDNLGATTITLEQSLDGTTFSKLADINGKLTSYTDKTALPNQKKYYRANVKNEGTCSSIYSAVSMVTSCPLAPTSVVAKAISSNTIEVKWDLGENMKTYIVERSTDNIDFVKAGEVAGTLAVFQDKNLASSKKYYYRVLAVNEGCTSAPSLVKQESTATTCPAPPSNLVAVANSAKEIKVTFTDNSPDELGFELEWSKDGVTFAKVGSNISPNSTTTTINTGVTAETKYFFRVKALGEICNSDFSNIANVTTNPPAPTGLTANGVKINQVDLAWINTSKTATTIEIQRSAGADNNFAKIGGDVAITTNSFQNTALNAGTAYNYRVRYNSPNGTSDWSNVASATTVVISANEDSDLAKQITLHPVPTENTLYIKPTGSILGKVSTKIVNLTGATLISQEFNGLIEGKTEQINVTNLSSGMYFLEITTKKGSATKKFLKR